MLDNSRFCSAVIYTRFLSRGWNRLIFDRLIGEKTINRLKKLFFD